MPKRVGVAVEGVCRRLVDAAGLLAVHIQNLPSTLRYGSGTLLHADGCHGTVGRTVVRHHVANCIGGGAPPCSLEIEAGVTFRTSQTRGSSRAAWAGQTCNTLRTLRTRRALGPGENDVQRRIMAGRGALFAVKCHRGRVARRRDQNNSVVGRGNCNPRLHLCGNVDNHVAIDLTGGNAQRMRGIGGTGNRTGAAATQQK